MEGWKIKMADKYINRIMEKTIKKLSKEFPALMITGPRQVGKTTLLQVGKTTREHELCVFRLIKGKNFSTR